MKVLWTALGGAIGVMKAEEAAKATMIAKGVKVRGSGLDSGFRENQDPGFPSLLPVATTAGRSNSTVPSGRS